MLFNHIGLYKFNNNLSYRCSPLEKVGVYVPGGKASYPSSVLMNCIPGIIAGVKEIYMTVPSLKNLTTCARASTSRRSAIRLASKLPRFISPLDMPTISVYSMVVGVTFLVWKIPVSMSKRSSGTVIDLMLVLGPEV